MSLGELDSLGQVGCPWSDQKGTWGGTASADKLTSLSRASLVLSMALVLILNILVIGRAFWFEYTFCFDFLKLQFKKAHANT